MNDLNEKLIEEDPENKLKRELNQHLLKILNASEKLMLSDEKYNIKIKYQELRRL